MALKRDEMKILVGAVAVLAVVGGVVSAVNDDSTSSGESSSSSEVSASEGEYFCEEFVKDHLKAPTTAEFHSATSTAQGQVVTVRGQVASANSLGGTVDNTYTCKVRDMDGSWQLVSLSGLDR